MPLEAGGMAQWFGEHSTLAEDPGSVARARMLCGSQPAGDSGSWKSSTIFWSLRAPIHLCTCLRQNHIHTHY